jgi:hypothetical protein
MLFASRLFRDCDKEVNGQKIIEERIVWVINRVFCLTALITLLFTGTANASTQSYQITSGTFSYPEGTVPPLGGYFSLRINSFKSYDDGSIRYLFPPVYFLENLNLFSGDMHISQGDVARVPSHVDGVYITALKSSYAPYEYVIIYQHILRRQLIEAREDFWRFQELRIEPTLPAYSIQQSPYVSMDDYYPESFSLSFLLYERVHTVTEINDSGGWRYEPNTQSEDLIGAISMTAKAVPIPGSVWLLLSGLLGIGGLNIRLN